MVSSHGGVDTTQRLALLAIGALAAPVVVGVLYSGFAAVGLVGAGAPGFTTRAVEQVLTSSDTWRSVAWTTTTAAAATALATSIACAAAMLMQRRATAQMLGLLPLAVPHAAAALAVLLLLGQSGLASRLAHAAGLVGSPGDFPALVYDPAGIGLMLAFTWKETPYLMLTALAILRTRPVALEEEARTLGASPMQTFWRVTWPGLWRGLTPPAIAVFAFLLGVYEMPALLAPSNPLPLPLLTYEAATQGVLPRRAEAHVLGLMALAVALGLVVVHVWQSRRWRSDA